MSLDQHDSSAKVVALAGRRTDAPDTDVARFPLSSVETVRSKLYNLLIANQATKLVSSAACGADLVALDVAGELAIERHIIIPFSIAEFRRISVTDRPGEWGPLYDRVIAEVLAQGLLQILGRDTDDDSAFSITNKAIITTAQGLASEKLVPLAVVVWEGQSHEPIDATREFAELAEAAEFDLKIVKSN
jgi:hypothetical protein